MSMYKNIFVNENDDASASVQIQGIDGEVKSFGATAFSSVEEAIAGVTAEYSNAVIRVASGKYDTYYVVSNEGVYSAPASVVAVDFTGGTVVSGDEQIAIDAPGFSAEEQLSIISELNANNAANGTIFVAEGEVADSTIVVGMGEANYVAGQSADAVYGADAEEVYTVLNNMLNVDMLAATEVASGQNVYFSSTNSSQTYVFKAGSVAHNELSKWDMTGAVTIEGGAKLVAGRNNAAAIAANTPQTAHIKNTLTLAGTADNKAVLNFLSETRQDASLGILYNGKLVAEHAEISVADLGFTGTASMSDCTVYVDGVVAFGKNTFYKQTMTNTTMNVRGHNRHNENKYFSTEGVILNNLTMTNSSINVDNGVDGAPEKVTIKKLTMNDSKVITEGALEITGTLTIDSDSLLKMDSLTFGSSGKITLNLLNGFTGGKIIDITGATGLTEDILSKITIKGGEAFATIQEGDIYVYAGKANADFNFNENENENNSITEDVTANKITLNNSKEVAVTGEIKAFDSATITNSKAADGEEGKLNGGYDADGKELAAKITAGKNIVIQNDGHANVDLDAKNIVIANNSKNTLMGNIGTADTENIIIADGEATADGVTIDGNGTIDGAIKEATITAANIEIGGQEVSDTTLNGYTEIISDSSFTDVATSGIVSVGYKNENAADTTLTMAGETSIGTLYVGNEGRGNEYKAVISGNDADVTLSNLYSRTDSVVEISDKATVNIGYWQSKGSVLIDNATVNHTGVNMYVYNNDSTSTAEIKLTNGATLNSDANYAIYLGNSEGGPAKGNAALILESGSTLNTKNLTLHAAGTLDNAADGAATSTSVSVTDSTLNVTGKMTNNGTVTVSGESTLNIGTLTGSSIDLLDGAIIKNSTVGGNAYVAGDVTFRGDNTFSMITDYGDYYSAETPSQWTVEQGASLTLTASDRYGLGYGDKVAVYGSLENVREMDAETRSEQFVSLDMHGGLVQMTNSAAPDAQNTLTIQDARVRFGFEGDKSFGNKSGNYYGNYAINVDNTIFEANGFKYYEDKGTTDLTFTDSILTVNGILMTNDSNSTFTFDNTSVLTKATSNGSDDKNQNAGTLNIQNNSDITYNALFTNIGTVNVDNSAFIANAGVKNDATFNVSGNADLSGAFTGKAVSFAEGTVLTSANGASFEAAHSVSKEMTFAQGDFDFQSSLMSYGKLKFAEGADVSAAATLAFYAGGEVAEGAAVTANSIYVNGGDVTVSGNMTAQGADGGLLLRASNKSFNVTGGNVNVAYIEGTRGTVTVNLDNATVSGGHHISEAGGVLNWNIDNSTVSARNWSGSGSIVLNSGSINLSDTLTVNGSLTATDSFITANAVVNNGTISLTVTDDKLASLGADTYYMIEQTSSTAAALDLGVTYNGEVYKVGDIIPVEGSGVVYKVVAGDNNDIAIQALAKTVLLDSSIEGNGFNKFSQAGDFFEQHDSYEESIKGNPEVIMVNGENVLDTTASKYYFYSDSDLSIAGGTLDVSKAGRFYFMDTVAANGTAAADADFSNVATVTVEEGATLKGYINLGQAIDSDDVDDNGNVTRDGGAMNMVVKGTLDHKNLYVNTGSTLTVTETGKVTNYAGGGDNHVRAGAKVVVNGAGKDGDVQFTTNWWSIRGGEMEFNNTNAKTGTLRLNADADNALITDDTSASLKVTGSKLAAYSIEVDNADSSFTATGSEVAVTDLLENYGSMSFDNSTVTASRVTNSGTLNVDGGQLKANSIANAGALNIFNSTLENTVITGSGDAYIRAENAVLTNLNVSGQETRTVNTDFNGGTYTGKVYTGYGLVDGKWSRVTDSETTVTGTVDASSVYWQNYGKLTIAEGAELKTAYFSEGSKQVLTVDGTISAGTFRGYNGYVSETGKINAQAAVQFYGNPDTKQQYDINGEVVVTHDIAYAHNIVVGFDTAKQWYGDGPNDYWNIGGANTEVNVSGEKAKLQIVAGKAGKGTAMIHVDEEGTRATLNISDEARFLVDGKVINNGNLNIADNAVAVITGNVTNSGSITVDASSSFTAGAIVNTGTFNSDKAGEMIVLGDMTVTGNITSGDLTLKAGVALSAGSITVTNLNLTLGSTLTLTSSAVSTVTGMISVFGEFSPENAEFVLVAKNWNSLGASDIYYDANNNGLIDGDTEKFAVGGNSGDYLFTVDGSGNLVMSKADPIADHVFIGEITAENSEVVDGKTFVVANGVRYEVGKNAFENTADAVAVLGANGAEAVAEITVGDGDHIYDIASDFVNVQKITVPAGMTVEDDAVAQFKGDIEIVNAGHLDAKITTDGKLSISNTSLNTLLGEQSAGFIEIDNANGRIGDAADDQTKLTATRAGGTITINSSDNAIVENTLFTANGYVALNDDGTGTYGENVDVKSNALFLNGVNDLTLDADSNIGSVYMGASPVAGITEAGKLTIDGAVVDQVIGGDNASGEVVFTANSNLADTIIEDVNTITLNGGAHEFGGAEDFREYYFDNLGMGADTKLTWGWNDSQILDYNIGTTPNVDDGMIIVTNSDKSAELSFAQTGEYSLDTFDVSAFDGKVSIADTATLNLAESTDYFADGAEVTVSGTLNLDGTGAFTETGMDFNGTGDINVNTDHTFTADAALNGFSGNAAVNSTLTLEGANTTNATFSGNGKLDLQNNQTFEAAEALNDLTGTLNNGGFTLDLNGANDTAAIVTGSGQINANDDLTLSSGTALNGYTGDIAANGSTVTLEGANTTYATFSGNGTLDLKNNQTFEADKALDDLTGTLNNGGYALTLDGINAIGATVTGSGNITANADQSFSGDVSAYTGSYTTAANTVTFTDASTLAANMTLNGAGKFVFDSQDANVTVNSDSAATNLCINDNNFTLIGGKYSYITGTTGSVLTIDSNISATEVAVDGLIIKAGDNLTAEKITASTTVVYIEDTTFAGPAITVTDAGSSFGNIMVNSWSSAFETPFTIVDSSNGQTYNATVVFVKTGSGALGTSITVNDKAELIDGKFVRVYTQDGDLLIGNYEATSNVVYVNSDWSTVAGAVEKWTVAQGDSDRIIDRDASKTLENAVAIMRAEADGKGMIYVVKGDSYSTPAALMTADNKVTDLTIEGKGFEEFDNQAAIERGDVMIEGGIVALDSARSGSLTLNNVSVAGNVYGGAVVTADAGAAADKTSVNLNGGYFTASMIAGGSYVEAGKLTTGESSVNIVNNSDVDMMVMGNVIGGSVITSAGASVEQAKAGVTVNVGNGTKLTIRGDIYAAGANLANGSMTVGETSVTFTGDAAKLTFTGRVSGGAYGYSATVTDSNLIFDDFTGTFKGLVQEFNTITISGDTELEFSRKQTLMGETDFVFDLTERTANDADAMFTVNKYGWTYGDSISVNTGSSLAAGTYVLVDNWSSAYDVNFSINGVASQTMVSGSQSYTIGESSSGKLYLSVKDIAGNKVTTGAGVAILDNVVIGSGSGDALTVGFGSEEVIANGTTTINGNVNAPYAEANTFTVNDGMTTVNGEFNLSYGDDALVIKENAGMQITGSLTLGGDVNNLEVGKNAELTVNGNANFGGGTAQNIITLGKGAVMNVDGGFSTGTTGSGSALVMDVDSILNNANGNGNKPIIAVDGVSALTTDVAGAKAIINALDWSASAVTNRQYTIDNVDAVLGTATQIAGVETVGDTSDDVWAALNKVDNQLVASWGRTEMEAGAALDAFKADSTLTLGDALVAVDDSLLDGFDSDDNLTKKNNGTLA